MHSLVCLLYDGPEPSNASLPWACPKRIRRPPSPWPWLPNGYPGSCRCSRWEPRRHSIRTTLHHARTPSAAPPQSTTSNPTAEKNSVVRKKSVVRKRCTGKRIEHFASTRATAHRFLGTRVRGSGTPINGQDEQQGCSKNFRSLHLVTPIGHKQLRESDGGGAPPSCDFNYHANDGRGYMRNARALLNTRTTTLWSILGSGTHCM